jgi:hypothetical protein
MRKKRYFFAMLTNMIHETNMTLLILRYRWGKKRRDLEFPVLRQSAGRRESISRERASIARINLRVSFDLIGEFGKIAAQTRVCVLHVMQFYVMKSNWRMPINVNVSSRHRRVATSRQLNGRIRMRCRLTDTSRSAIFYVNYSIFALIAASQSTCPAI